MGVIIEGKVEKGKGKGAELGFPTLNIPYDGDEKGVFVGRLFLNDEWKNCAVFVSGICEVYLLKYESVGLGTLVKVELLEKIREVEDFDDFEALKAQISKDVEFVKEWYNRS